LAKTAGIPGYGRVIRKLLGFLFAGLVALAPATSASQSPVELDRDPLSPPGISSPRATLDTFLTEVTAAFDAYYAGDLDLPALKQ